MKKWQKYSAGSAAVMMALSLGPDGASALGSRVRGITDAVTITVFGIGGDTVKNARVVAKDQNMDPGAWLGVPLPEDKAEAQPDDTGDPEQ
jgi:hypothetical protein